MQVEATLQILVSRVQVAARIDGQEQPDDDRNCQKVGEDILIQPHVLLEAPSRDSKVGDGARVSRQNGECNRKPLHAFVTQQVFLHARVLPIESCANPSYTGEIANDYGQVEQIEKAHVLSCLKSRVAVVASRE